MIFLGIDPGLKGAICRYQYNDLPGVPSFIDAIDMPVKTVERNGKKKHELDMKQLSYALAIIGDGPVVAIVEDVHSMPKQGVVSSFSFGFVAGAIQQAVIDRGFDLQLVPPATWKRRLGLTSDKAESFALATKIFPQYAHLWAKKSQDGRAEAALLAYYGSKHFSG